MDDTLGVVWHQVGEDIYGDTPHEQSGYAIALNFRGDTIAIGSPYYNRTTDPHDEYEQSVPYVGQVRIFVWDADLESWNLLGKPIRGTQAAGRCGFSVHMGAMGRNFVLGCPRAKDYTHVRPNAGMVKVMKWLEEDEKWVAKGSPIYGNTTNIMAGIRVSMSGDANTMAFIAPGMSDAGTVQTEFLGWGDGLIARAADWLVQTYGEELGSVLVAVPGGRAGRVLSEELARRASPSAATPRILTPGSMTDEVLELDCAFISPDSYHGRPSLEKRVTQKVT